MYPKHDDVHEALTRRRMKMHSPEQAGAHQAPGAGHSSQPAQDDYESKMNQGAANSAPPGTHTEHLGSDDNETLAGELAKHEAMEEGESGLEPMDGPALFHKAMASENTQPGGLRGAVLAHAAEEMKKKKK